MTHPNEKPASPTQGELAVKALDGEALHLTEYEIQVLLGCSISGCNMSPDRVFSLPMAWRRLHAVGLIDRTDGLAIITEKGRRVIATLLSALDRTTLPPTEGWQPTHRHVRRGSTYKYMGAAILQTSQPLADMDVMAVYVAEDGTQWVRPRDEFVDGRFEALLAPQGTRS